MPQKLQFREAGKVSKFNNSSDLFLRILVSRMLQKVFDSTGKFELLFKILLNKITGHKIEKKYRQKIKSLFYMLITT